MRNIVRNYALIIVSYCVLLNIVAIVRVLVAESRTLDVIYLVLGICNLCVDLLVIFYMVVMFQRLRRIYKQTQQQSGTDRYDFIIYVVTALLVLILFVHSLGRTISIFLMKQNKKV